MAASMGDSRVGASSSRNAHPMITPQTDFAGLFKDNRGGDASGKLHFIEPPNGDICFSFDEIDNVEDALGYCLVGCILGPQPKAYIISNFIRSWGPNVKYQLQKHGWIKFLFPDAHSRDLTLNSGPYMIHGKQLFLKEMPPCFLYDEEDLCLIPSWVQILGLPPDCWTTTVLSNVASVLGKPIHADRVTLARKFTHFARVLVELDISLPRIHELWITLPTGRRTKLEFRYEFVPRFCCSCNIIGHVANSCAEYWELLAKKRVVVQQRRRRRRDLSTSRGRGPPTAAPSAMDVDAASRHIRFDEVADCEDLDCGDSPFPVQCLDVPVSPEQPVVDCGDSSSGRGPNTVGSFAKNVAAAPHHIRFDEGADCGDLVHGDSTIPDQCNGVSVSPEQPAMCDAVCTDLDSVCDSLLEAENACRVDVGIYAFFGSDSDDPSVSLASPDAFGADILSLMSPTNLGDGGMGMPLKSKPWSNRMIESLPSGSGDMHDVKKSALVKGPKRKLKWFHP